MKSVVKGEQEMVGAGGSTWPCNQNKDLAFTQMPLEGFELKSVTIWPRFLKDHEDCCWRIGYRGGRTSQEDITIMKAEDGVGLIRVGAIKVANGQF